MLPCNDSLDSGILRDSLSGDWKNCSAMISQSQAGVAISMVMLKPCPGSLVGRLICKHCPKQENNELVAQENGSASLPLIRRSAQVPSLSFGTMRIAGMEPRATKKLPKRGFWSHDSVRLENQLANTANLDRGLLPQYHKKASCLQRESMEFKDEILYRRWEKPTGDGHSCLYQIHWKRKFWCYVMILIVLDVLDLQNPYPS